MEEFKPTQYILQCVATGREFEDTGWVLDDKECKSPSLVRAIYAKKQIEVRDNSYGIYKFADWLPISRMLEGSSAPVTYRSKGLAEALGLKNTLPDLLPSDEKIQKAKELFTKYNKKYLQLFKIFDKLC